MGTGNLFNDALGTLISLSPIVAVGCFVLAVLALRGEGGTNFNTSGGFTKWLTWSAIFAALPWITSTAAGWAGIQAPSLGGGAGVGQGIVSSATSFIQYIGTKVLPAIGGMLVFKALLDLSEGKGALGSIISALLVFGTASGINAGIASVSTSTSFDSVLTNLLSYATGTLSPTIALVCAASAVVSYARGGPWKTLLLACLGFLSVTAITQLLKGYS